jgi:biopolymer transport protein ExbD
MKFRGGARRDEPEINLIPLIDLFLVIIIFLMVTTTYSKFAQLKITLPTANAEKDTLKPATIDVAISADGRYALDGVPVPFHDVDSLAKALVAAAAERRDPVVVISADAQSTTQTVVNVMQAARLAQISQITFATQTTRGK